MKKAKEQAEKAAKVIFSSLHFCRAQTEKNMFSYICELFFSQEDIQKAAANADKPKKEKSDALAADSEDNLTPNQYTEIRKQKLDAKRAQGENPYPHKFHVSIGIGEFIKQYGKLADGVTHKDDGEVSTAGRIHSFRASGAKLVFYDLRSEGKIIPLKKM